MSHVALQHVIVRMLYDPDFVERVYDDPHAATQDCDLTEAERGWLVRADRRAWGIDPLRRARSMAGLIEEFPVTCARLVRALGLDAATPRLDRFFSSVGFHHDLQNGSTLAESFGHWLAGRDAMHDVDANEVLAEHAIEHAIVRARRSALDAGVRGPSAGTIRWAKGVDLALVREGAVQSFASVLGALRRHPQGLQDAVLDPELTLDDPPSRTATDVGVLVLGQSGDVQLESISIELATILEACRQPIHFDDLCLHASKVGATREDVRGVLESFSGDGVLVR